MSNLKSSFTVGNVVASHIGSGKWNFSTVEGVSPEKYSMLVKLTGGKATASKVASILGGSLNRSKNKSLVDGLARSNINRLVTA